MLSITIAMPDGSRRTVPLVRARTSVGRATDNGVVIDHPSIPECALQLEKVGESVEMMAFGHTKASLPRVAGKPCGEARLKVGDRVELGEVALTIEFIERQPRAVPQTPAPSAPVAPTPGERAACDIERDALATLHRFSQALLGDYQLASLLELMMDQVIALTHADRGFLILLEDGVPAIKVARGPRRENLSAAALLFSDSIVARVLKTRRSQLVHDALSDPEFSQSASVASLRFLSVLCVPLLEKGEVIGLIYLGNDRFAHRFDERARGLLEIWAAQGSLILRNALLLNELRLDNETMREVLNTKRFGDLVGTSAPMRDIYRRVAKVAPTDVSVLITGETGTGKELVAREIHRRSPRAKGPFVTINCGAIPETLLESELFGHLRGAFTGAVATRKGRFQAADGGTIFLDEIGEMPLALQVKILRVLQERTVTKVGDNRADPIDIRVVAATNRVLTDEIRRGRFREDLYYRLNVVTLDLPPLRARGEDVLLLAGDFLRRATDELGASARGFAQSALNGMRRHAWPGNVRELENRVKKAVVLADRALVTAADLDLDEDLPREIVPLAEAKDDFQRRYINQALALNGGNRTQTARALGVDPRTIYRHLEAERQLSEGVELGLCEAAAGEERGDNHGGSEGQSRR